ncbi:hypothetical protein ACFQX8_26230 [Klenkia terrae]|uniref:hypothetical protein n=1 Tax=Klenkia terrae TaxID=1052259 RepID=UPI00360D80DC
MSLFGVAQGGGFALALTLIVLRSATPLTAARLGGVAQCLGYLVAATGPVVLGALHDLTGGWSWSLGLLLVLLVPMAWAGWGRPATSSCRSRRGPEPYSVGFGASEGSPSQSLPAFWAFSDALSVCSATVSTISRSLRPSPAASVCDSSWPSALCLLIVFWTLRRWTVPCAVPEVGRSQTVPVSRGRRSPCGCAAR